MNLVRSLYHLTASTTLAAVKLPRDIVGRLLGGGNGPADRERERAESLRREAEAVSERADARLKQRQNLAQGKRAAAADGERIRKDANRKATAKQEAALEDAAKRERLEALREEDAALATRDDALTARDESQRLARAAARAKKERKR